MPRRKIHGARLRRGDHADAIDRFPGSALRDGGPGRAPPAVRAPRGWPGVRSEEEIRSRLAELEEHYNRHDPPVSPVEEELEVAILRAIEELEWVLGERESTEGFTT